ncbi:MAG: hypothetical protein A2Y31_03555 [Spirochaetes bacterium GWC2_52_13]|nr:MAG: hypothetical protein A2Y31_03555 [Spirochaetes bacterium GWC2_52_13]HCG63426.1 hypothetical protein [Sphaerochaeta sp.]
MNNRQERTGWVHLILALVTLSWGFNNILMKVGFQYVSAPQFSGIRMVIAFPFMLYFAFWRPGRTPFARKDLLGIMIVGVLGLGLFQILFPIGIDETSASLGGVLMAVMPVHVVILSIFFRLERPEWKSFTGVALTLVGLAILTLASGQATGATDTTLRGILFVVVAELGYAINTTFLRPYMKRYPPLQVTGLAMATSVILYMLVFFKDLRVLVLTEIHPVVWLTTAYSGLVAFLLANILWNLSVKHIGSTKVSVYGNLPPVIVLFLSAILFHDVLNNLQMLGALIILSGVILVQFRKSTPIKEPLAGISAMPE